GLYQVLLDILAVDMLLIALVLSRALDLYKNDWSDEPLSPLVACADERRGLLRQGFPLVPRLRKGVLPRFLAAGSDIQWQLDHLLVQQLLAAHPADDICALVGRCRKFHDDRRVEGLDGLLRKRTRRFVTLVQNHRR